MIDAYASFPSYLDHLAPIMAALPDEHRGHIYGPRHMQSAAGIRAVPMPRTTDPLLVAGVTDLPVGNRPKVLVSHGADQTYMDVDHESYVGGRGRDMADLFIGPRPESVARDLARYPRARAVAVGCPKLDAWAHVPKPVNNDRPVVAVAFHWDCKLGPETGTAFPHFAPTLADLASRYEVLGHAHPRAWQMVTPTYRAAGIELVQDPVELLARADLLVADNTSLMYEWAACGRPVVALNAPEWRRDIEHGLRFWSHVPGPQCNDPNLLAETIAYALRPTMVGTPTMHFARLQITNYVYGGMVDGHASERAAGAVLEMIGAACA